LSEGDEDGGGRRRKWSIDLPKSRGKFSAKGLGGKETWKECGESVLAERKTRCPLKCQSPALYEKKGGGEGKFHLTQNLPHLSVLKQKNNRGIYTEEDQKNIVTDTLEREGINCSSISGKTRSIEKGTACKT